MCNPSEVWKWRLLLAYPFPFPHEHVCMRVVLLDCSWMLSANHWFPFWEGRGRQHSVNELVVTIQFLAFWYHSPTVLRQWDPLSAVLAWALRINWARCLYHSQLGLSVQNTTKVQGTAWEGFSCHCPWLSTAGGNLLLESCTLDFFIPDISYTGLFSLMMKAASSIIFLPRGISSPENIQEHILLGDPQPSS